MHATASDLTHDYVVFCSRHNVAPSIAVSIPATFETAANKLGVHVRSLINQATFFNQELADYLIGIAQYATEQVAAEEAEEEVSKPLYHQFRVTVSQGAGSVSVDFPAMDEQSAINDVIATLGNPNIISVERLN